MLNFDKFDFEKLAIIKGVVEKSNYIKSQIQKIQYLPLSEALVNRKRRGTDVLLVIQHMAEEGIPDKNTGIVASDGDRYKFAIKCLKDKWGNAPKAGDIVHWKKQLYTKEDGKEGRQLSRLEIDEEIRQLPAGSPNKWNVMGAAKVDKYGCIHLRYDDAAQLLNLHGTYYLNGAAISKKVEVTKHPQKRVYTVNGVTKEDMKVVHNWRYQEVPKPLWDAQRAAEKEEAKTKKEAKDNTNLNSKTG